MIVDFVDTKVLNTLNRSKSIILTDYVYSNAGETYTFPKTIPEQSILVMYTDLIVIDNRLKWIAGNYASKSLIALTIAFNDGINLFTVPVKYNIDDFNIGDFIADKETYLPNSLCKVLRMAVDVAQNTPPFYPTLINSKGTTFIESNFGNNNFPPRPLPIKKMEPTYIKPNHVKLQHNSDGSTQWVIDEDNNDTYQPTEKDSYITFSKLPI